MTTVRAARNTAEVELSPAPNLMAKMDSDYASQQLPKMPPITQVASAGEILVTKNSDLETVEQANL